MTKNNLMTLGAVALVAVVVLVFAPVATASDFNHRTVFTVNQPIRIPGNVVLPPGTYVMRLLDPNMNAQLVQILNATETKVYATVFAVPEQVKQIAGAPRLEFGERPEVSAAPL